MSTSAQAKSNTQKKHGWRGYNSSRKLNGSLIPQRVQNLVIRSYAETRSYAFLLSLSEYYMDECFMILDGLLEEIAPLEGVIFYSTHMLPKNRERRLGMFRKILSEGCELHFALEELTLKKEDDIDVLEDMIAAREIAELSRPLISTLDSASS